MLKSRYIKILKWVGYPLFALVCLLISLLWTFPVEQMTGLINKQLGQQHHLHMDAEELETSLPLGFTAIDVRLDSTDDKPNDFLPLIIPRLSVKAGLFSLIAGTPAIDLSAEIFGGRVEGSFKVNQDEQVYVSALEIENLLFEQIPYFKNKYKDLPIKGTFSLNSDITLNLKKLEQSKGFAEMKVANGSTGPGKFGMELPLVRTGNLDARFEIDKGRIDVKTFQQSSPDMESDMRGSITLSKKLGYSRANLDYRFKLTDELLKKDDIFKLALSTLNNAKGSDGFYYHTLRGTLNNLKPVPNKAAEYKFTKGKRRTSPSRANTAKPDQDKKSPAGKALDRKRPTKPPKPKVDRNRRTPPKRGRSRTPGRTRTRSPKPVLDKQDEPEDDEELDEQEEEEFEEELEEEEEEEEESDEIPSPDDASEEGATDDAAEEEE